MILTTMESDYYINFEKQIRCEECPFREALGLDDNGDWDSGDFGGDSDEKD